MRSQKAGYRAYTLTQAQTPTCSQRLTHTHTVMHALTRQPTHPHTHTHQHTHTHTHTLAFTIHTFFCFQFLLFFARKSSFRISISVATNLILWRPFIFSTGGFFPFLSHSSIIRPTGLVPFEAETLLMSGSVEMKRHRQFSKPVRCLVTWY